MVRLADLDPARVQVYRELPLPSFSSTPWVKTDITKATVAIVTTAGLHHRDDKNFEFGAGDFRVLPGDVSPHDLRMSHVSVNFDRSGFLDDVNVVFPIEHLRALEASGEIGGLARWHYSLMGATDPARMVDSGKEIARLLKADGVTAALLVPV